MLCPVKTLPEWKLLISKYGEEKAYKIFIKNNEEVPTLHEVETINYSIGNDIQSDLFPGFNLIDEQIEAINTIAMSVLTHIQNNPKTTTYSKNDKSISEEEFEELSDKKDWVKNVKIGTVGSGLDNFKNILSTLLSDERFKVIDNNFKELGDLAIDKLRRLELIKAGPKSGININSKNKNKDEGSIIEGFEETKDIDSIYREDSWVFSFDQKSNAQQAVKQFLAFIPKTIFKDNKYQQINNYLGLTSYMNYDEVFEQLHSILAEDDVINTWDSMYNKLLQYQEAKPWIYNLLYQIDNYKGDKERLKIQFVVSFSSSYSKYSTLLWKETQQRDEYGILRKVKDTFRFNFIRSDRNSIIDTILNQWNTNYKISNLLKVENQELVENELGIDKISKDIIELKEKPSRLISVLESIGIEISDETAKIIIAKSFNSLNYEQQFKSESGLFKIILDRLKGIGATEEENIDKKNPIVSNSAVRKLARLDSQFRDHNYSNSVRNVNGDTVYSYTINKFLTTEYKKLINDNNYLSQLLNITFNKPIENSSYKTWLNELLKNKQFKDHFEIVPFDGIRKQEEGEEGLKLTELNDSDLETLQLSLIQQGRSPKGIRLIKYLFTIPAKTTSYVVTGSGITPSLFFNNNNYQIDAKTIDAFYQIFASEHNRIINSGKFKHQGDYEKGKGLFYFFPQFNDDQIIHKDGQLLLPTTIIDNNDTTIEQYVRQQLVELIKSNVNSKISNWTKLGIIKNNKLIVVDSNYKFNYLAKKSDQEQIIYAALDYVVNASLAKYNTHQIFIGDPALYYKKDVPNTWDNISKRLAGVIAPGKDFALTNEAESFLSIKLSDRVSQSLNYAQLLERLPEEYSQAYLEITGTDAQEFITIKEAIDLEYKEGKLSTEQYKDLINRLTKDDFKLTNKELKVILGPKKPVYFGNRIDQENDVVYKDYIKSSSIPLIPQFTKGLELDKLRKAAEKLQHDRGLNVRLVFKSGYKLGGTNEINIWNEDGSIKDDLNLDKHSTLLSRSNLRLQQEIPYDPNKEEVVKASQPTKLLFDSILGLDNFSYNGKKYTGQALFKEYTDLHRQMFEQAYNTLKQEILDDNGQVAIPKLQKILKEEAISRGYNISEIDFLKIDNLNKFVTALWANPSANKFESLITSLYTNNIVRQKMHGKSFVLVTEEGFQGYSKEIIYTKEYTGKLLPMRLEDGKVKPAQILLPWNFRTKTGKKISISQYIDENGLLDTSKIDSELLTSFGFRIPNQGHNSMGLIQVVGFLPDYMRDTVVASRDFVAQMGSDFDVDKLYLYDFYTTKLTNGKIKKLKGNIKNKILDIHKSVLYNPEVFNSIVSPLSNIKDSEIFKKLKAQDKTKISNYLSPDYARNKFLESVDGKSMVAALALQNTATSLLQQIPLKVNIQKQVEVQDANVIDNETVISTEQTIVKDTIVIGYNGIKYNLSELSDPTDITGRKKNRNVSSKLSGAVDNEKDPVLGYVNLNLITSSVSNIMDVLGCPEEYTLSFLAQPVLKEFVSRVKVNRSSFNSDISISTNDILYNFINEKFEKVKSKFPNIGEFISQVEAGNLFLTEKALNFTLFNEEQVPTTNQQNLTKEVIELIILVNFEKYKRFGEFFDRAKSAINLDSSGIGKGFIVVNEKIKKLDIFTNEHLIAGLDGLLGFFKPDLDATTIAGHQMLNSLVPASKEFRNLFPYNKDVVESIFKEFANITLKDNTTEDQKYEIWNNLKSYLFSDYFSTIDRNKLFFDSKTNKSLATRTLNLKKSKFKNNPLILRLEVESSYYNPQGDKPSLVFYNSAKEEYIEEHNIYQGFNQLFNDPLTKDYAVDLVKYFYLNGGIQQAKEWGRYINPNYLESIGFSKWSNEVEFNDLELISKYGDNISHFMKQYFQHKSYLLKRLDLIKNKDNIVISKDRTIIELPNIASEKVIQDLSNGVNYVQMFRTSNDNIYLYNNLDGKYHRIAKLGDTFYTEYNNQEDNNSLIISRNSKSIEKSTPFIPQSLPIEPTKEQVSNPEIESKYKRLLTPKLENSLIEIEKTGDKSQKFIANYLLSIGVLGDIILEEDSSNPSIRGSYGNNKILVNLKNVSSPNALKNIILHEGIHAIVDKTLKKEGIFTSRVGTDNLTKIYNGIIVRILNGNIEGFDVNTHMRMSLIHQRAKDGEILDEGELKFIKENYEYYPLVNLDEFIVGIFENVKFQNKLNEIKWQSNDSLLKRIQKIIIDILKAFKINVFNVKEDSLLEESLLNLFNAINSGNKSIQKSNNKNNDVREYSLADANIQQPKENYKKIIGDIQSRITNIEKNIIKARIDKDKKLEQVLIQRKEEVEDELDKLKTESALKTLIDISKNDLNLIEKLLDQPKISLQDIDFSQRSLGTWINLKNKDYGIIDEQDKIQGNVRYKTISEITSRANELYDRLQSITKQSLLEVVNKETNKVITEDALSNLTDINTATSWFMDLSKTGKAFINVLDKAMKKANTLFKRETANVQVNIKKLVEDLKKNSLFQQKGYDLFIQKTKDGKRTSQIITEVNLEYNLQKQNLLSEIKNASDNNARKRARTNFNNWIRENHNIVDIRKLYEQDKLGSYVWKPDIDYLNSTKELFDEIDLINQKKLVEEYNELLNIQIKNNEGNPDGFRYIERWKAINDPLVYINNLVNGFKSIKIDGKNIFNSGYRYTITKPHKKWQSEEYKVIQSDPVLKSFYDYYSKTIEELINYIPPYLLENFSINTIPAITKDLIEQFTENGMRAAGTVMSDKFIESISVKAKDEKVQQSIDPSLGKVEQELYIRYLNNLDIDKKDQSFDLGKILNIFSSEVLAYKHKSNIEDFIRVSRRVLEDARENKKAPNGKLVKDKYGEITNEKALKNLMSQLDSTIEAWYGHGRDEEGVTNKSKILGKKLLTAKDKKNIAEEIAEIEKSELPKETKEQLIKQVNEQPRRVLSWGKLGDTLLQYVQLKGMGWNVFSGVTNYVFGKISNYNYAAGGVDFTYNNLWESEGIIINPSESKKLEALMIKYDTLKDILDTTYKSTTNNNTAKRGLMSLKPFALQRLGEYHVQSQTMISMMLNKTIKIDGKDIRLWDAYDEKGEFKYKDKTWEGDLNDKSANNEFLTFKLHIDQVIKRIHGNYDPNSHVKAKRYVFGRALLQFRSWIAEGVAQRFEERRYDELLGREVEGRIRTLTKLGLGTSIQLFARQTFYLNKDKAFDVLKLNPEELAIVKENMKRNLAELYSKVMFTAFAILISGMDDDDEDYKKVTNFTLNQLYRLSDDIEFFYSPIALENITRSVLPAFTVIQDGSKFIDGVWDTALGEGEYRTGKHAGDSKMFWKGIKLVPFGSTMTSLYNKLDQAEEFRN